MTQKDLKAESYKLKADIQAMRHTAAHVMATAIQQIFPGTKFGVGPVIEHGFFYDVETPRPLTPQDLPKIEKFMRQIIQQNYKMVRSELPLKEAIWKFRELKQDYKVSLLEDILQKGTTKINKDEEQDVDPARPDTVSLYTTNKFVDLCRGPHVESTHEVGAFKLTHLAGAYWRGSEKNKMLTRIYGLCFATQKELDDHLAMLAEAEKRDHRKIGQAQELFFFDDMVGKGLPLWLPHGTIIKDEIEKLAIEKENQAGFVRVSTPHLAKEELFLTSGHLPYYKDSMYPAMTMDDGTYYLKAMNCPPHHLIYRSKPRSYRDLPLRLAEYGTVYRNELSGTLAGLLRVRMLSMNDAHLYCRKDQIEAEFTAVLKMIIDYFKLFKLKDYWFRLSKWDANHKDKYIDEPQNWEFAEGVLRAVLKKLKVPFTEVDNEAAFYGPKVDVMFKSVIGREETMSTVQLDFAAKKRFRLAYTNEKGEADESVFVIHRAPLSTHERFMAFLIEHFAGAFPTWLSPVQMQFIPVTSKHNAAVKKIAKPFIAAGVRVHIDDANETVGYKIRKAEKHKVPYMLVIGDKEKAGKKLSVRVRGKEKLLQIAPKKFLERITGEIIKRK